MATASMAAKKAAAQRLITLTQTNNDLISRSMLAWMRRNPTASMDAIMNAIRKTVTYYTVSMAPAITATLNTTISDVIPSGASVSLHGAFMSDHMSGRVQVAASAGRAEDIAGMASTILTDAVNDTLLATSRYYLNPPSDTDAAALGSATKRMFYRPYAREMRALEPRSQGKRREWVRVLEPVACDWCRQQTNPFARHSGCRCTQVLRVL